MSIRADNTRPGILRYYDPNSSYLTVGVVAPVTFYDDFLGRAQDVTNAWGTRDTAAATEALVADAPNGVYRLALDATNEVQVAGLDWGDQRTLVLNQYLGFEARVKLSTLPTTGTIACIGLCGDYNAAVDSVAESIWFRLDGVTGGLITVETDDGTTESSKVTTGVTVTTSDWAILRIDCADPTNILFFINGAQVASTTTFSVNAVPTLALQPVFRIGKESAGTNVGALDIDSVRIWQRRAAP
jgi:hypothetical protein